MADDSFKVADEFCLQQARKELLEEKLTELGESCKQLLCLSWDGRSMEEVAGILNVTYGYARKRKSECMSKLVALVKKSPQFNTLKW
jgi:DNA-directed RNA polymerase specialized sigma24 family protein